MDGVEISRLGQGRSMWDRSTRIGATLTVVLLAAVLFVAEPPLAKPAPNVVQVSKKRGVTKIGDLRVVRGYYPTTLRDAAEVFGKPGLIRRPYKEVCEAYFGRGLRLDFASFGLVDGCYDRSLQAGLIRSRYWKVKVGNRIYRVGMAKRRVPKNARFVPRYGFELASFRFATGRTGSAYALIGGKKRIRSLRLFVGLAGD